LKIMKKIMSSENTKMLKILGLIALLGVCVQYSAAALLAFVLDFMPEVKANYEALVDSMVQYDFKVLIYVALLAPIVEEAIFRIVLMWAGLKFMPFWAVNLSQAVLFGLYHGNWVQGIYAFILGLLLGYVRYDSKNLMTSMMLHIFINLGGIAVEYVPFLNQEDTSAIIITIAGACIVVSALALKRLHILWNEA